MWENDENTLLLLRCDELIDSSSHAHEITNENVGVNVFAGRFGGNALYFNGSARLLLPSEVMDVGTGDFTVDFWVLPNAVDGTRAFFGNDSDAASNSGSGAVFAGINENNAYVFFGRSQVAFDLQWNNPISENKWSHIAFVRSNGVLHLFVNGVLCASAENTQDYSTLGNDFVIGADNKTSYFAGWIDDFRISNVARWTENFALPVQGVVFFKRRPLVSAEPDPVAVTITGTGHSAYVYTIINGTTYTAAASGIEVAAGDVITFTVKGKHSSASSKVTIDGTKVAGTEGNTTVSYEWAVPEGITNINIDLGYGASVFGTQSITVTTS